MPRRRVSPNEMGPLLANCRMALGLRQSDLAERLDVNKRTVAYWESLMSEGPPRTVWWVLYYWLRDAGADLALLAQVPVPRGYRPRLAAAAFADKGG